MHGAFVDFSLSENYGQQWKNLDRQSQPKILILGDSYFGDIAPFFVGHFSEVTLMHVTNMYGFHRYLDEFSPDIVIIEAVERVLDSNIWPEKWFNWTAECFEKFTILEGQ